MLNKITAFCTFVFLVAGGFLINNSQSEAIASSGDCGMWVQADRYDRYPCAGPPDDCFELCPIIIEEE